MPCAQTDGAPRDARRPGRGFFTNSDMYGYPASHFGLPMEAVERIELVRGTGALQYGAQFGGMLAETLRMTCPTPATP